MADEEPAVDVSSVKENASLRSKALGILEGKITRVQRQIDHPGNVRPLGDNPEQDLVRLNNIKEDYHRGNREPLISLLATDVEDLDSQIATFRSRLTPIAEMGMRGDEIYLQLRKDLKLATDCRTIVVQSGKTEVLEWVDESIGSIKSTMANNTERGEVLVNMAAKQKQKTNLEDMIVALQTP